MTFFRKSCGESLRKVTQTTRASFSRVICNFAKLAASCKNCVWDNISMTSENHFRGDVENCGQISMLQQNFTCGKIIHKIISKIWTRSLEIWKSKGVLRFARRWRWKSLLHRISHCLEIKSSWWIVNICKTCFLRLQNNTYLFDLYFVWGLMQVSWLQQPGRALHNGATQ